MEKHLSFKMAFLLAITSFKRVRHYRQPALSLPLEDWKHSWTRGWVISIRCLLMWYGLGLCRHSILHLMCRRRKRDFTCSALSEHWEFIFRGSRSGGSQTSGLPHTLLLGSTAYTTLLCLARECSCPEVCLLNISFTLGQRCCSLWQVLNSLFRILTAIHFTTPLHTWAQIALSRKLTLLCASIPFILPGMHHMLHYNATTIRIGLVLFMHQMCYTKMSFRCAKVREHPQIVHRGTTTCPCFQNNTNNYFKSDSVYALRIR